MGGEEGVACPLSVLWGEEERVLLAESQMEALGSGEALAPPTGEGEESAEREGEEEEEALLLAALLEEARGEALALALEGLVGALVERAEVVRETVASALPLPMKEALESGVGVAAPAGEGVAEAQEWVEGVAVGMAVSVGARVTLGLAEVEGVRGAEALVLGEGGAVAAAVAVAMEGVA